MDKRVIVGMGLAAGLFVLIMAFFGRPSTEPVDTVATVAPAPTQRRSQAAPAPVKVAPKNPLMVTHAQPLSETPGPMPGRPSASGPSYQPLAEPAGLDEERAEARREYRCRTLQEQADLMDRLIVVGGARTLAPEQRLKMASRVATLGTRVYEEDENIRTGRLDCGDDGGVTNMTGATDFLVRARDELGDLLGDQDQEEIDQAIVLFESTPEL